MAAAGPGAPPSGKGKGKGEHSGPGNNRGDGRPSAPDNPAAAGAWGKVTKGTPPPPVSAWGKPPPPRAAVGPDPAGRGKDKAKAGMLPAAPSQVWGRKTQPGGGGGGGAAKPAVAGDAAGASRGGKGGRQNPPGTKGPLKPRAGGKKGGQPDPTTRARGKGNAGSAGAAEAAGYPTLANKARPSPAANAGPLPAGLLKVPRGVLQPTGWAMASTSFFIFG